MQQHFHKAREIMIKQVNQRRKKISYEIKNQVFLFSSCQRAECKFCIINKHKQLR